MKKSDLEMKKRLVSLLDEAAENFDQPDSEDIAEYLIERGVAVPLASVGDNIYVIIVKKDPGKGRYNRGFQATSMKHLKLDCTLEVVKKTCTKSDLRLLGGLAFTTEEAALALIEEAKGEKNAQI